MLATGWKGVERFPMVGPISGAAGYFFFGADFGFGTARTAPDLIMASSGLSSIFSGRSMRQRRREDS